MVLKRFLLTALAALGLSATAVGPSIAQTTADTNLPPPDRLAHIAECIRMFGAMGADPANLTKLEDVTSGTTVPAALTNFTTGMGMAGTGGSAVDAFYRFNPTVDAGGGSPAVTCMTTVIGSGRNAVTIDSLVDAFTAARARMESELGSDLSDDDFNSNLATLRSTYGGPVFEALYNEYVAALELDDAESKYQTAFDPPAPDVGDDPPAFATLITAYNGIVIDSTNTDNQVRVDALLGDSGGTNGVVRPTVTRNAAGAVTGLTGAFTRPTNEAAVVKNPATVEALNTEITTVKTLIKDYSDALASRTLNLDSNERAFLGDVVAAAQTALSGYEGLLSRAEAGQTLADTATAADRATARTNAANFRTRLNRLQSLADDVNDKIDEFDDARTALRDAIEDPADHLAQLKAAAEQSHRDAVDDGLSSSTIRSRQAIVDAISGIKAAYDSAVGDGTTPSAQLLASIVAQGDTGQALVNAISDTYNVARGAADTAAGAADDARQAAREIVNELTGPEGQVTKNTTDIGILNGEVFDADGMSRIDMNEDRSKANAMEIGMDENGVSRIDHNEMRSRNNDKWIMDNSGRLDTAYNRSMTNEELIGGLTSRVGANESAITGLRGDISGLQDQMEVVRAGVAASMALAGMPAINGRGVSIGVGSYDGESAFAVGFQIQGEMASFKVGVTSAGGETGASAGVGFQF